MPYSFSSSTLHLLEKCPRCFWLHFRKKIRRPPGMFPSLPSGMDKILKIYFDECRKKKIMPEQLIDIQKTISLFQDIDKVIQWRKMRSGLVWEDNEGNKLSGAVDDMLIRKNKLIVLDFKTGGYPPKETLAERYKLQLNLYNFLLGKEGFKTENFSYILFFYPSHVAKKNNVSFNTELIKIPLDKEQPLNLFKKAITILSKEMPDPDKACGFCFWVYECAQAQDSFPSF